MSDLHRLSKEEYYYMGKVSVWTLEEAANLLASFEMETGNAFKDSKDLYCFDMFHYKYGSMQIEFVNYYKKWYDKMVKGAFSDCIEYINFKEHTYDKSETGEDFLCADTCLYKDDILSYIDELVHKGEEDLDIIIFYNFLDGKGTAPTNPISEEDSASSLASSKTIIVKKKIKKYVSDLMKNGCGCWHTAMRHHVMNHFMEIEKEDHQTKDKDKVSLLSRTRQLTRLREVYTELGKVDLIYDLSKHAGKQNPCSLPSHSK